MGSPDLTVYTAKTAPQHSACACRFWGVSHLGTPSITVADQHAQREEEKAPPSAWDGALGGLNDEA